MQVTVIRKKFVFSPDSSRVIARFLYLNNEEDLSPAQKALIGSYFTMEYSIESAAFFNPSIIEHPDQSELRSDEKRVIFSFRATGEGHISSVVFRSGILDRHNNLVLEPVGKMMAEADKIIRNTYNKKSFREKLDEMQNPANVITPDFILEKLGNTFTYGELMRNLGKAIKDTELTEEHIKIINQMKWLASAHYEIHFSIDSAISERVIFPISATEQRGIEDARFV